MRRSAVVVAALASACLVLTACSSGTTTSSAQSSDAAAQSDSASGSASGATSSVAPTPGPAVPAATDVATAVAKDKMPTVTGKFGDKPQWTWPEGLSPNTLQRQILVQGDGAEVKASDWLVANYEGIVWGADKPFDNSYDRKAPTSFQIGTGAVVSGWDVGLVGMKIGSRVLLSLPPADGYGSSGNSSAGIKGTDTIVFVIDIVDSLGADRGGQADAKAVALPATAPKVSGKLGEEPTIEIGSAKAVTANQLLPLSVGTGEKLAAGDTVLAQIVATAWDGSQTSSTWASDAASSDPAAAQQTGLQQIQLADGQPPVSLLIGQTVGSRILLLTPEAAADPNSGSAGSPPAAIVVDLVAKG